MSKHIWAGPSASPGAVPNRTLASPEPLLSSVRSPDSPSAHGRKPPPERKSAAAAGRGTYALPVGTHRITRHKMEGVKGVPLCYNVHLHPRVSNDGPPHLYLQCFFSLHEATSMAGQFGEQIMVFDSGMQDHCTPLFCISCYNSSQVLPAICRWGNAFMLHNRNVVVGISDNDFRPMMFYDACFLVQYMLSCTLDGYNKMDKSLCNYFEANDEAIFNDVMRLENQIPWQVVETLMRFRHVPLKDVAGYARGYLQDRKDLANPEPVTWDDSYKPPHLLGFLRFYIVERRINTKKLNLPQTVSFSVSAIELAEMGIEVKVSKTKELKGIGLKEGRYNLFVPQLSLDNSRACVLVNMAAFELCTIPDFSEAGVEDSAVCSYLQVLGMLIDRMEDVQELRRKRVLQGGGGLTNEQVLDFTSQLQHLRLGSLYIRTMVGIENYQLEKKPRVWLKSFVYNHGKTVAKVLGGITTLVGILGTIVSLERV